MFVKDTISSRLRNFFQDHGLARDILPYALGKRIAYQLPVPKEECYYKKFYTENLDYLVGTIISEANEKFHLDVREANKITYVIWNTRCRLIFDPQTIDFLSLLNYSKVGLISQDTLDRLYSLNDKIVELHPNAVKILENILIEEISHEQ